MTRLTGNQIERFFSDQNAKTEKKNEKSKEMESHK